jgi:hypothetical protein
MPQLVGTGDLKEPRPLAPALRALGLKQAVLRINRCTRLGLTPWPSSSREASAATIRVPSVGLTRATSSTTRSVAPNGRR